MKKRKSKEDKRDNDKGTVYVLENNQLKAKMITKGISDNKVTEVLSGELKVDDQVITEDLQESGSGEKSSGSVRVRMF